MAQDSDIYLKFYVNNIMHDGETIYFAVVPTNMPAVSHTVTRITKCEWSCTCGSSACGHIHRAMLYYNNMLARSMDLKEQLQMRKEMREQPTVKKRMIRPQGE